MENYDVCPPFPRAGSNVAAELQSADAVNYRHTWEWIARLEKLKRQLELCRVK